LNFVKTGILILFIASQICLRGQERLQIEILFVAPLGVEQGLRQSMVSKVIQDVVIFEYRPSHFSEGAEMFYKVDGDQIKFIPLNDNGPGEKGRV
jgi:hypothetical protein